MIDRTVSPPMDENDGRLPRSPEVLRKADLITLPREIIGTNCGNCRYVKPQVEELFAVPYALFCTNPIVAQDVTTRNCCALWDNFQALRDGKPGILQSRESM